MNVVEFEICIGVGLLKCQCFIEYVFLVPYVVCRGLYTPVLYVCSNIVLVYILENQLT